MSVDPNAATLDDLATKLIIIASDAQIALRALDTYMSRVNSTRAVRVALDTLFADVSKARAVADALVPAPTDPPPPHSAR